MKELRSLQGGYPRQQDYLLTLQSELLAMGNSILGSISFDVILSGCAVTNNNNGTVTIAPGIVYIAGQVLRFDGAANINADGSKAIITGGAVTSGPLVFFDTSTKNAYAEVKGIIGDKAIGNARQLIVGVTILTFETYIDLRIAASAPYGTVREFIFESAPDIEAFLAKFDDTGLGVTVDMVDWQLMNGNNGPDARGRVTIGVGTFTDPNTGLDLIVGSSDTGGEQTHHLTQEELPNADLKVKTGGPINLHGTAQNGGNNTNGLSPDDNGRGQLTISLGGGDKPHNIMQPWIGAFKVRKFR